MPCFVFKNQNEEETTYRKSNEEDHAKGDVKERENGENHPPTMKLEKIPIYLQEKMVEINNDAIFVKELIIKAATAIGAKPAYFNCYAIILKCPRLRKIYHLHPDLMLEQLGEKYGDDAIAHGHYLMILRYLPIDYAKFVREDPVSCEVFYDGIVASYLSGSYSTINMEVVSKLGALQLQLELLKMKKWYLKRQSLDLDDFIPRSFARTFSPDSIRKAIRSHLRSFKKYTEHKCRIHFLDMLMETYPEVFSERYLVEYGSGALVPTRISLGLFEPGIRNETICTFIDIAEIESIEFVNNTPKESYIILHLSTSKENVVIATIDLAKIDAIITYIDGNNKLHSNKASVCTNSTSISKTVNIDCEDYSHPADRNYEIDKNKLEIRDKVVTGKFSEIFIGYYKNIEASGTKVAVKMCNADADATIKEMFVEEAYMLHRFNHNHIIKLMGILSGTRPSIVTEYAELGALNRYLRERKFDLDLSTLLLYTYQVSLALRYLESLNQVHKYVASENVLVMTPACVKLSGFEILTFSCTDYKNKLPLRWMAPESINSKVFTQSSTIWSFGVCVWEILTRGTKPYENISDDAILATLERGERLQKPSCCSEQLYLLLQLCWESNPTSRPKFKNIKDIIYEIYLKSKLDIKE